jgi:hypothetical protein
MTVEHWLASACADAERRNLPGLKPLLTSLSQAMHVLRNADWNDQADGAVTRGLPSTALPSPSLGTDRAGKTARSNGAGAERGGRE